MPFLSFLFVLFLSSVSTANSCKYLLDNNPAVGRISAKLGSVYATQDSVGFRYAVEKRLDDLGLNRNLKLNHLSKSERRQMEKVVLAKITKPKPAVVDPMGRVFILDGHHDLFLATRLLGKAASEIALNLLLLADYRDSEADLGQFKQKAIKHNWFHSPMVEALIENPLRIFELADSPERSQMGFAFKHIKKKLNIPFSGKHFAPFIQFELVQLFKEHPNYDFENLAGRKHIADLADSVVTDPRSIALLKLRLLPSAPASLADFVQGL